jgi:hypothetical protein
MGKEYEVKIGEANEPGDPVDPTVDIDNPIVEPDKQDEPVIDPVTEDEDDLSESQILRHFEKNGRKVESIDELFKTPEQVTIEKEVELPDNVKAFYEFHKQTGRSMDDFVKLNKKFEDMDEDQVLAEYYLTEYPSLSREDVLSKIKDDFGYDPEDMVEADINRIKINKKIELERAFKKLNSLKEQYNAPLASSMANLSEEEQTEFEEFKNSKQLSIEQQQAANDRKSFFQQKTVELFSDTFEGFKMNVGTDTPIIYKPEDHKKLASDENQSINYFAKEFLDENGKVKDVEKFHKAIYFARNMDSISKHLYEKGAADAIANLEKTSKNLDVTKSAQAHQVREGLVVTVEKQGGKSEFKLKTP